MNSSGKYTGIHNYGNSNDYVNVNKKIILSFVFIVVFIAAIMYGSKVYKKVNVYFNQIAKEDILYYIEVTDKASSKKAQVNWQEVAAINQILNNGNKDEKVEKIAELFLSKSKSGEYNILTINEVLSQLKLDNKSKESILNKLKSIEDNSLSDVIKEDNTKKEFIESLYKEAEKSYNEYGVLPSITLAQAILESGWGQSELATEHNNLFGIKADKRWDGAVATIATKENYDDTINASFRKYNNIQQSIKDHGKFLYSNARYKDNGVFEAKEYISQAQALEDAGYSTAKNESGEKIYADKLIDVVRKYNLMLYDSKVKIK